MVFVILLQLISWLCVLLQTFDIVHLCGFAKTNMMAFWLYQPNMMALMCFCFN